MDCWWRTTKTNQHQFNQFLIIVSNLSITADNFSHELRCGFLEGFAAFLQIQTPKVLLCNTFPDSFEAFKIGISGALDGPQHNVNTFDKMSSMIWWWQTSHRSSRPSF